MNEALRTLILDAYRENRLAAVHIDMQNIYYNQKVFEAVSQFVADIRALNVPNIWVAWPDYESNVRAQVTTVEQYQDTNQSFEYHLPFNLAAEDHEILITKMSKSALYPGFSYLRTHLNYTKNDVIFLDGVTAMRCVLATIKDGIKEDPYHFVVVTDGVDIKDESHFRKALRDACFDRLEDFDRRVHMVKSNEIVSILRESAPAGP